MSAPRNDTFSRVILVGKGWIRWSLVHGRINLAVSAPGARVPLTTPSDIEITEQICREGLELVALARAARTGSA